MNQVMTYEIKSSAASNAEVLFSNDKNYFYWNDRFFKNLDIGDYVFVVNKSSKWVLFTTLDKVDIKTKSKGMDTVFLDMDKEFLVSGKWDKFIRVRVIEKVSILPDWQWQSFGSAENAYFYGERVNFKRTDNRITNIEQFRQIFKEGQSAKILDECEKFIRKGFVQKSKALPTKPINDMKPINVSILTAIKTKPFILLAGISGTGKSRLVRTLAFQTCPPKLQDSEKKKPGNFELIPVRPNWHDSTELMGYVSRIDGEKYIATAFLQFIAKAWQHTDVPFFLCLDEMNLAPVEQYFAEYLSIVETRQNKNGKVVTDYLIAKNQFQNKQLYLDLLKDLGLSESNFMQGIGIPENLVVIGTVNMDETTHSFSRKVLDRAMTFEMNEVDLSAGLDSAKNDWSYSQQPTEADEVIGKFTAGSEVYSDSFKQKEQVLSFLKKVNAVLEGTPFKIAYRVRDEFLIYCYHASQKNSGKDWLTAALDELTSMKILSRIEGDENKTGKVLEGLLSIFNEDYKKSHAKILEMQERLQFGYTSFWS